MFYDRLMEVLDSAIPTGRKVKLARKEMEKIIVAEEALERERILQLHKRFRGGGAERKEEDLTQFSAEERVELSQAHTDKIIWNRPFTSLFITELRPLPGDNDLPIAYIRLAGKGSPAYQIHNGYIKGNFKEILLTNTAQTGKWFKMVISNEEDSEWRMLGGIDELTKQVMGLAGIAAQKTLSDIWDEVSIITKEATTCTIYNVALTLADTEYSQLLPSATKVICVNLTNLATFRYAWVTGKVATPTAPYGVQVANRPLEIHGLNFSTKTLYFADSVGGQVMQIAAYV